MKWIFLILLLSGCADALFPKEFEKINNACKEKGGWVSISKGPFVISARCHNGDYVSENVK